MTAKLLLIAFAFVAQSPIAGTAGGGSAPQNPGPGLISKAMRRYYDANSVVGKIRLTQTAKGASLVIDTVVQFERPSKLLIQQTRGGSSPRTIRMASDGEVFSYDRPERTLGRERFKEFVTQKGYSQTVRDLYTVAALSAIDRSPVLDIVMGRRQDLADLRTKWGSPKLTSRIKVRDIDVNVVEGKYYDLPGDEPTGTYQFLIADDGDIVRYAQTQRLRVPDKTNETIEILSIWDADLKVDVPTDAALYKP